MATRPWCRAVAGRVGARLRGVVTLASDTDPRAEVVMIAILRRMTPAQRLHRSFALRRSVLALARSRIVRAHPDASEQEVKLRLAALWLDRDTMRRVWGWDSVTAGV